jgi:hypothetical protein
MARWYAILDLCFMVHALTERRTSFSSSDMLRRIFGTS